MRLSGEVASTVGRTGINVKVYGPLGGVPVHVGGQTGWPGSVTETVKVSGVPEPPAVPAKSLSSNRSLAPVEVGLGVVDVGIGNRTLIFPEVDVYTFPWPSGVF